MLILLFFILAVLSLFDQKSLIVYKLSDVLTNYIYVQNNKGVAVGTSSIALLPEGLPSCRAWTNRGFFGSNIDDILKYVINSYGNWRGRPVVLYAGENALAQGQSIDLVFNKYGSILEELLEGKGVSSVSIFPIKLSIKRKQFWPQFLLFNNKLEMLSAKYQKVSFHSTGGLEHNKDNVQYYSSDLVHLNDLGYELFFEKFNENCN